MKKVLLATTALVATAGVAAAEVEITGFAEIGVFDPGTGDNSTLQFHTDIDATFVMTTETDSGLTFGAEIDLDETDTDRTLAVPVNNPEEGGDSTTDVEVGGSPAFDNDLQGGEAIFVQGPFGLLTMGDTDGALDWALQEAIIGASLIDDNEHAGYNGNAGFDGLYDGQVARYEYAFGDFAVALSGLIDDSGDGDPVLGIGARYSTEFSGVGLGFGVGYQRVDSFENLGDDIAGDEDDTDSAEIYGVSADLDFGNGFRAIVNYSDSDSTGAGDFEHIGLAVGYTVDALTVAANYGRFDRGSDSSDNDELDNDDDGYSLIVNYDLGGGAEAQFGYARNNVGDDDFDTYSAGIAISF